MKEKALLKNIPSELTSERLLLKTPCVGDGQLIHDAIVDSFAELRPWMPWAGGEEPQPLTASVSYCRNSAANFILREDLPYFIFERATQRLVGSTGLHRINWDVPSFEIGYWCRTGATGRGYVTETVHTLSQFAFEVLEAERVEILCDNLNLKSAGVAERCGYVLEGVRRRDSRNPRGEVRDTRVYSKTRAEWFSPR